MPCCAVSTCGTYGSFFIAPCAALPHCQGQEGSLPVLGGGQLCLLLVEPTRPLNESAAQC